MPSTSTLRYLEENSLLSPSQHGFRPNRSCKPALASVAHFASSTLTVAFLPISFSSIAPTLSTPWITLSYRKSPNCAFGTPPSVAESFPHRLLFQCSLLWYGIFRFCSALMGAPGLRPWTPHFLIYVNDMPVLTASLRVQYAHDTMIIMPISSTASSADLQEHLQVVHN